MRHKQYELKEGLIKPSFIRPTLQIFCKGSFFPSDLLRRSLDLIFNPWAQV